MAENNTSDLRCTNTLGSVVYLNAVKCETLHSSQLNIVAARVAKTPGALVEDPQNIVIRNVIKEESK